MLLDAARKLSVRDLRRALDYWRQALDHDAALTDAEALHRRRRLHISQTFAGMVRIDGDLDPEGGEVVMTALQALTDSASKSFEDDRTHAHRRADGLVDLCRDYLDHGDAPVSAGEKPHVTITVDVETLEGRAGWRCELDETGVLHPESARRLACDAGVSRVITTGRSEPLDVGRRTRTVPAAMRSAWVVRDGGCSYNGCDRPHRGVALTAVATGSMADPPVSTTSCCSAGVTTAAFMRARCHSAVRPGGDRQDPLAL